MDDNKPWYLSKRFWSNLVLFLLAICAAVQSNELFTSMTGLLSVVGSIVPVLNVVLGALSSQQKLQVPGLTSLLESVKALLSKK